MLLGHTPQFYFLGRRSLLPDYELDFNPSVHRVDMQFDPLINLSHVHDMPGIKPDSERSYFVPSVDTSSTSTNEFPSMNRDDHDGTINSILPPKNVHCISPTNSHSSDSDFTVAEKRKKPFQHKLSEIAMYPRLDQTLNEMTSTPNNGEVNERTHDSSVVARKEQRLPFLNTERFVTNSCMLTKTRYGNSLFNVSPRSFLMGGKV